MYSSQLLCPLPGDCINQFYVEEGPAEGSTDHVISLIDFFLLLFDVFYTVSLPSTISLLLSFSTFLLADIYTFHLHNNIKNENEKKLCRTPQTLERFKRRKHKSI